MQGSVWISLLRLIPPAQHDSLMMVTSNGMEIILQSILRTEPEYMVFSGRPSGSSDTGRVFFIPYDQITYLGYQKPVKEADVQALYGGPAPVSAATPAKPEIDGAPAAEIPPQAPEAAPEPVRPPSPPPLASEPVTPTARPSLAAKSNLLDRLRARVASTKPPEK